MVDIMSNERHRWSYMTDQQLLTRLNKIRNLEKLDAFLYMAEENGKTHLADAARRHYESLIGRSRALSNDHRSAAPRGPARNTNTNTVRVIRIGKRAND